MYKTLVADFCSAPISKIIVTNLVYALMGTGDMCRNRSQGRTIGAEMKV